MEYLFTKQDLYHLLENHKQAIRNEIENLDQDYLLKANEDELKQYLLDKFNIDVPRIIRESIYVDEPSEVAINVGGDPRYDYGTPLYRDRHPTIKGTRIVIHVPFEGEAELFKWQPSSFSLNPPRAQIGHQELLLVYEISSSETINLQQRYQKEVDQIEKYLQTARSNVENCLREVPGIISSVISSRKARLQKNISVVVNLGLPVRRLGDQTVSVSLPKKRRPSPVPLPKVSPGPYKSEPIIDLAEYDHILGIIESLTIAIERSPSAFLHMGEEQLRDHILIQLNGHYEGQATGETFNRTGKTDILVRVNDKNVFIGECKFWKGQKAFLDTIDQLFGYTCWSDTKTAVIIFNRNREHTAVLETIRAHVPRHPKYKQELNHKGENHFRYLFQHPEDANRNIYMAIIAINLPVDITA